MLNKPSKTVSRFKMPIQHFQISKNKLNSRTSKLRLSAYTDWLASIETYC
jgi:hypothetical protein